MNSTAALSWFARHEFRLAWREWLAIVAAGRRRRLAVIGVIVFAALLHVPAYAVVARFADLSEPLDKSALLVITACIFLAWTLMLSQAIESVTRVFYARADLDLILSSPVTLANIFSVRIGAIALSITVMALLFSTPFVDVLAIGGGMRWLSAYAIVIAVGVSATAVAVVLTIALFRSIGPARTRLAAQILAAVVGAGFVIALQVAAILSYGTLSRFAVLTSGSAASYAPDPGSIVWWPAHAVLGDWHFLATLLALAFLSLGGVMAWVSPRLAGYVVSASAEASLARAKTGSRRFRMNSPEQALRHKEMVLLLRDPWLMSQTLMQLLYLLPPALMLWRSFSDSSLAIMVVTPVIVMASGQLAGGLAWLTISGEDAADLIATAPITRSRLLRAKIEAVLILLAAIFTPFLIGLAIASVRQAVITATGAVVSAASATAIQLWFRSRGRRSQFRRRQTASRLATFTEAFASIGWAATFALALTIPVLSAALGLMTAVILLCAWRFSPSHES